MIKINPKSEIQIWSGEYVNDEFGCRRENDKNATVIQIEPGQGSNYMVEILLEEEEK